jgi:hypothetical protein
MNIFYNYFYIANPKPSYEKLRSYHKLMSARILLPLRAHIKRYLTIQYGKELCLSDRGIVPLLLFNLLEKHKKQDPSTVRPSQKLIDDKTYYGYPIFIGDAFEAARGLYLSSDKIKKFNDAVDEMIREEMYLWCVHPGLKDGATDAVVDYNIHRFRDQYGIPEDELPFDNLKRWFYRNRLRLDQRGRVEKRYEPQIVLSL